MPLLGQVLEKYSGKVRLVYKSFPLRNHRMALPAAKAALAAGSQGKFWPYYDKLYENYDKLTNEMLDQLARGLSLDMTRFQKDRNSKDVAAIIDRDLREGGRIGVRGTPTIFINGKRLDQRSMEGFSAAIDSELNSGKR